MKKQIKFMTRALNALDIGVVVVSLGLTAQAVMEAPEGVATYYCTWNSNPLSWRDATGNPATFVSGSRAWINGVKAGNVGGNGFTAWGMVLDYEKGHYFWSDGNAISIGAGGIEFLQDSYFCMGRSSTTDKRINLIADQAWKGPADPVYVDSRANISIGTGIFSAYWQMPLGVSSSVHNLTINGYLNAWFMSPANDLSQVDVRLESPARIYLPYSFVPGYATDLATNDAHLKARKLTLSGDGDTLLPIGGNVQYYTTVAGQANIDMALISTCDADHIASTLELNDGADLTASSAATFAIPNVIVSGGGDSVISGPFAITQAFTTIELVDDSTLRLGDGITESGVSAAISVSGQGTLDLGSRDWPLTGGITLGEDVELMLSGAGRLSIPDGISGLKSIRIAPGVGKYAYLSDAELAGIESITVDSGTLVLDEGQTVSVTTKGTASVIYGGGLVITDKVRTEPTITVSSGTTLQVFGNGLTADTTVTLTTGDAVGIRFMADATVASPLVLTTASRIEAIESVTGTIVGTLDVDDGCRLSSTGAGTVVFAGGGSFHDSGTFYVYDNSKAALTGGIYAFGKSGSCGIGNRSNQAGTAGRHLCVRDGGTVTFAYVSGATHKCIEISPVRDSSNYGAGTAVTFEIGEGGMVDVPRNASVIIGANQATAYLVLSGGTLKTGAWVTLSLGHDGWSTGVFQFKGGLLDLGSAFYIDSNYNNAIVDWTGGTLKFNSDFGLDGTWELVSGGLWTDGAYNGTRNFAVGIKGDCTLDLTEFARTSITNMPPTANRGEWYGNGRLTVKGGKTLVMSSMPGNVDLVLDDEGTRVVVDDATRVFDFGKCNANCVWRRPYPDSNLQYFTASAETADLAVRTLTVQGDVVLENRKTDRTVAVGTAIVEAGGIWDSDSTLVSECRTFGEMEFKDGALWRTVISNGVTSSITIGGPLTLASALNYTVTGRGNPANMESLITATEIVGDPVWTVVGRGRGSTPVVSGNCLGIERKGLVITLR